MGKSVEILTVDPDLSTTTHQGRHAASQGVAVANRTASPARHAAAATDAEATDTEGILAELLAGVLGVDRMSVDSHFFGTSLGDGARLGHTSSLHTGQAVPAGEQWEGVPAQRTETALGRVDPARCGAVRRAGYTAVQLPDKVYRLHGTLGAGCTLGVGALVHYGVTMGDRAELAPDSFLMKGEDVPQHARWAGNPTREIRDYSGVVMAGRM